MPGKSRRGKGKYPVRSKRRRGGHGSLSTIVQQPPVSQANEPVPQPKVPVSSSRVSSPVATVSAVRYPFVVTELRTIGILAGIILVILVVLAFVLS